MKSHLRWAVVSATVLGLGFWSLASADTKSEEKDVMAKVQKLAEALQKKQNSAALVKEISDKLTAIEKGKKKEDQGNELAPLMKIFSLKKRGGPGIGDKDANLDGFEATLQALAGKTITDKELKDKAAVIVKMAYVNAAIAEVIKTHPPAKFDAKKGQKKADWDKWAADMGTLADALAKSAKSNPKAFNDAAQKAEKNCLACHKVFRFDD